MTRPAAGPDRLADALVRAAATARWPDGSLLVDLDETVLRVLLAPHLATALARSGAMHPPVPTDPADHAPRRTGAPDPRSPAPGPPC